ncbi:endolytic transglycosylase MltG [Candidatus Kaiserbacteria bacterium CG10_big_fil_rev_8_21_14_0_10_56_12]|uniref:Endolytic transglycosylase MltG n=1 Tax=Candidatus Kaiserbacteria bacterium CG10_big_fil_rev_8_21_14_0_10_56_12 TaxID=1974611 RepID=A0A2H0UA70_9BACT|nr:MAG: endolytic transglycosylase MltG [Candidatus Kaiserbacteria bacterium CG10_big_fil_rev_8_21_14_0_10_56_12]
MKQPLHTIFAHTFRVLTVVTGIGAFLLVVAMSFPAVLTFDIARNRDASEQTPFPVTVDPKNKLIVEDAQVNALLEGSDSPLQAAAANTSNLVGRLFTLLAVTIADAPWYKSLAAVDARFVNITPGMRKEEVASAFGHVLGWNSAQKKEFLTKGPYASLPLPEGSYAPGVYSVPGDSTPRIVQALVNDRFSAEVLARYSTSTAAIVPLNEALTIASLIEREAGGPDDMRLISGIIWNRLFLGMHLQIDATLQYVKGTTSSRSWWPTPVPSDRSRASAYNTYIHAGLPPTPIASPSVASVIAALNPKNTPCLFYFHDRDGGFHCSVTYTEHVQLLKKYYGQGK